MTVEPDVPIRRKSQVYQSRRGCQKKKVRARVVRLCGGTHKFFFLISQTFDTEKFSACPFFIARAIDSTTQMASEATLAFDATSFATPRFVYLFLVCLSDFRVSFGVFISGICRDSSIEILFTTMAPACIATMKRLDVWDDAIEAIDKKLPRWSDDMPMPNSTSLVESITKLQHCEDAKQRAKLRDTLLVTLLKLNKRNGRVYAQLESDGHDTRARKCLGIKVDELTGLLRSLPELLFTYANCTLLFGKKRTTEAMHRRERGRGFGNNAYAAPEHCVATPVSDPPPPPTVSDVKTS
jgi:hypothetical protein